MIKRALISVYDKTGIVDFARALVEEFSVEIISTGGTASLLEKNGIPVTPVEQVTGFPEMMDGRVKTLHPKIHAAILANRDNPEHMRQLAEQGIEPIDMVVVNLYPFEKTVADPDCSVEQAIEMIDIGGPCMLRAAAKNHKHVVVVPDTHLLGLVLDSLRAGRPDEKLRSLWAAEAYNTTCAYDAAIVEWFSTKHPSAEQPMKVMRYQRLSELRYGENPHQHADLYTPLDADCDEANVADTPDLLTHQQAMSFNNFVDGHAALELCKDLTRCLCGTGFQPVRTTGFEPLNEERHTRRNLPHMQFPGRMYFITFRLKKPGKLAPAERDLVLHACRFWDRSKMDLHAAVVMPDHVHLLITPRQTAPGQWVPLGEIIHSIKRHSAQRINEARDRTGTLWQGEYFDRIVRDEKEYQETWYYIANNAVKKDLAQAGKYPWFWDESRIGDESDSAEDRGEAAAHRLETGATYSKARAPKARAPKARAPKAFASNAYVPKAAVFIKHTNACGVGISDDPIEAYRRAYLGDPNAAMGGILVCDFDIDAAFATAVMETYDRWGKDAGAGGFFVEVWIAPFFDSESQEIITSRKKWGQRVRRLSVGDMATTPGQLGTDCKQITGGMLFQQRDLAGLNESEWQVVTERAPSDAEMADLRLAWLICKHTKSNAITLCKDGMLIGNGAGQMSRVMSCRIATWLAKENGHEAKLAGSAAASDAFFPFADGPNILIEAGVTAIIQPGGSKRDEDTITACNQRNVSMIVTGTRHFKH